MDGVHESYHTRLGRHDDRMCPGTAPEIPDPAQGLAGGYSCGCEEYVGAPDQVVQRKLPLGVCKAVLFELFDLRALRRPHPGLHLPAEALHDGGCEDTFRGTSYSDDGVQVGPTHTYGDGWREVALRPYLDARSRLSDLLYQGLVPVAVQDGDGDLLRPAAERLRYGLYVLGDGGVYVNVTLRCRANDQLAHVHIRGPEHTPPRRRSDRRDRTLLPLYQQLQALDGLDREVSLRPSVPERVVHADYPRMALWRPDPTLLVETLLAQHRYSSRYRDSLQLLAESLRGERVGPLRVSRTFEVRHLERDPLGHGGKFDGSRSYGSRVGISNVNGLSPNLPLPIKIDHTSQSTLVIGPASKQCGMVPGNQCT